MEAHLCPTRSIREGSWLSIQATVWKARNWGKRRANHTISWSSSQAEPILRAPGFMSEEKWKAKYSRLSRRFLNTYLVHGNPLQSSCLENPMDRGAWPATVSRGSQKVGRDWSDFAHTHTHIPCARTWLFADVTSAAGAEQSDETVRAIPHRALKTLRGFWAFIHRGVENHWRVLSHRDMWKGLSDCCAEILKEHIENGCGEVRQEVGLVIQPERMQMMEMRKLMDSRAVLEVQLWRIGPTEAELAFRAGNRNHSQDFQQKGI